MRGFGLSADPQPCRCLLHITPVIPNSHFIPSSLLFSISNTQLPQLAAVFKRHYHPTATEHPAWDQTTATLAHKMP
jgi:hypothetical protein|tara:strand:- start:582 stop:809 length:228 start_codon:yes stop_codon:yes gene_type:complete